MFIYESSPPCRWGGMTCKSLSDAESVKAVSRPRFASILRQWALQWGEFSASYPYCLVPRTKSTQFRYDKITSQWSFWGSASRGAHRRFWTMRSHVRIFLYLPKPKTFARSSALFSGVGRLPISPDSVHVPWIMLARNVGNKPLNAAYHRIARILTTTRLLSVDYLSFTPPFLGAQQPPSGPGFPRSRGFYITPNDALQLVGLLCRSYQPVAETST